MPANRNKQEDESAATLQELQEKLRGVEETFVAEFHMGSTGENQNYGPPPTMKSRKLIFDSMQTIINNFSGDSGSSMMGKTELARHVYVCGAGYHAQLGRKAGRGEKKYATLPIPVHLEDVVRQLSCGALHTAVVTDDGQVLTWGDNSCGQLGHGGTSHAQWPTPKDVVIQGPVSAVACGQYHTVVLTQADEVLAWGYGKFGQLGNGSRKEKQPIPSHVRSADPDFQHIAQISCGDKHSCFVTKAGHIFTCGLGDQGQLGHGLNESDQLAQQQLTPKKIQFFEGLRVMQADCGSITTAAVTDEGKVYIWGFGEHLYGQGKENFQHTPVCMELKQKVVQVACGQTHVLVLTDNGDVYAWGGGEYGQIGQGADKAQYRPVLILVGKNIRTIACGRYHSAAISDSGFVYAWGCGDNGQLGRPESTQDNPSKQALSVPKIINSLSGNIVGHVSCGEHHTCVIASCRYATLPEMVRQHGALEEMEFEFKVGIASRHRGRGIPRRDVFAVRRWRREEEIKREDKRQKRREEQEARAKVESTKILSPEKYRDQIASPENRKKSESSKKNTSRARGTARRAMAKIQDEPVGRRGRKRQEVSATISAKDANNARTGFHQSGTHILGQMAQTLYDFKNPKIDGKQYTAEDMMKRKFHWRKKYDSITLIKRKKKLLMQELEKEWKMIEGSKANSKNESYKQTERLQKLKMMLNTITIKINEVQRNRETYELNISNIKDEGQETHKKLDVQRHQLQLQENLQKKIRKFGDISALQKDTAANNIREFKAEILDWRNFLRLILTQVKDLTSSKEEKDSKQREQQMKIQDDIKRSKTMKKIQELLERVDLKEEERTAQSEIRVQLEEEIAEQKMMFGKLRKATNKKRPQDIIIKYQLNTEVSAEYEAIRDHKREIKTDLEATYSELTQEFVEMTSSKEDHTWREVDALQEQLMAVEAGLNTKTTEVAHVATTLEQLKEWMTSIISKYDTYLGEWNGVEDKITQANRDDVLGVLNALQTRITTFRQIIQHQQLGTQTVYTKK